MRKNLLYSIFAKADNDEWKLNVQALLARAHVFDGRKIVIVRSDEQTLNPVKVLDMFAGRGFEHVHVANDPKQGEGVGFLDALQELHSLREDEATFYAHTKGVTHAQTDPRLRAIRTWRNGMYKLLLERVERVEKALVDYACAGVFKTDFGTCKHNWHYSGNFWWVNHAALFSSSWKNIPEGYYGVEAYLGNVFETEKAGSLAFENVWHLSPRGLYGKFNFFCTSCNRREETYAEWDHDEQAKTCKRCKSPMTIFKKGSKALRDVRREIRRKRWENRSLRTRCLQVSRG